MTLDWTRYKALCDTPDVLSRWMLEQTLELLAGHPLAECLRQSLRTMPLDKPADHRGGSQTDMFRLSLSEADVRTIRQIVEAAAAGGRTTSGTRRRGLGGFVEAWAEYERLLAAPRYA